eukprot:TRINITY_DN69623_c0_g1_i2.p1 TRINITY_DN69623_c0_g1~~TRINITY_DN69623_c0_g1_i2.p1  ORF type:complete len:360 (-),score=40.29 TRINITY_DN69623_c0_g1_i2:100-1179(-)
MEPARRIQPYFWDGRVWSPAPDSGGELGARSGVAVGVGSVRLATLNVLADCFPWFIELATASRERYAALVEEIAALDATVIALQEVTPTSITALLASPFVRANYYVTELPSLANGTFRVHGCVLLSKLPFAECYAVEAGPQSRRPIVGVFSVGGVRVAVCALHTTAYQTPRTRAARADEISGVVTFLRSLGAPGGHFIVGDLNLHYASEDGVAAANSLLDVWAETHFGDHGDADPGYTFDPLTNPMIGRYIPGEARRMRLDRILCSCGAALSPTASVRLWANTAVDSRREIFLSDHYGLVVDLALESAASGFRGDPIVAGALAKNARVPDGPGASSTLRFAAAIVLHLPWLMLRSIGWW